MTTVFRTYSTPGFLTPVSSTNSQLIQKAYDLKFYYRGGKDVVAITQDSSTSFSITIPVFSTVFNNMKDKDVSIIFNNSEKEIKAEMELYGIGMRQGFLFDTYTKKILVEDSFIDYTPYYTMGSALFIMINENGDSDDKVYHPADASSTGILQLCLLILAKRELLIPKDAIWSTAGKQLLSFLISSKYKHYGNFLNEKGCWDSVDITLKGKHRDARPINIQKMNTKKALSIAGITEDEEYAAWLSGNPFMAPEEDLGDITLTDVLQAGLDSFLTGPYSGVLEVDIDVMKDTFASISIDTGAILCFVKLLPGVNYPIGRLMEDLQSDNVQILE